jgi:penicillin-binding protein 2
LEEGDVYEEDRPLLLAGRQAPVKELNLDPAAISAIRSGLYDATHSGLGTSSSVFGHYQVPIAGKTGTAETHADDGSGYAVKTDTSWWCGFGPYDSPSLVVCAVIENGGFGGAVAAPAALQVFEEYFHKKAAEASSAQTD